MPPVKNLAIKASVRNHPREFKINEYLTLKLENRRTNIYVKGEKFSQCKYLLLNIPVNQVSTLDDVESIDEAANKLDRSLEGNGKKRIKI